MVNQPPTEEETSDLRELLRAMGSGHFPASRLHAVHKSLVARHGRPPMHPIRLGQVLSESGVVRKAKWEKDRGHEGRKYRGYMVKGWVL